MANPDGEDAAEISGGDFRGFHIFAVGERDAMSVNMRNAGLGNLNEKYMLHLRNTMRREVSLISMDQRCLLNRFNKYSMTMVSESLAATNKDTRSYLQYLKAKHQQQMAQAEEAAIAAGQPDPMVRSRTFIESQRVTSGNQVPRCASLERLRLLTRPSRAQQAGRQQDGGRLRTAPVGQVHPEFAPSLHGRANRLRTAPTPATLLRMHYQRVQEEDDSQQQQQQQQRLRRANSTLGFSAHDASLRSRALGDVRFQRLREALQAAPKKPVVGIGAVAETTDGQSARDGAAAADTNTEQVNAV